MEIFYLLFICVTFTTVQVICPTVNTTLYNDDVISKLSSAELRDLVRAARKRMEAQSERLGYVLFDCCYRIIKNDLDTFWPTLRSASAVKDFVGDIMTPSLWSNKVEPLVESFEQAEKSFNLNSRSAKNKIPSYFEFMLACIVRCKNSAYSLRYLKLEGLEQARFLRKFALDMNGLTENDDEDLKYQAFVDFVFFYAKMRHGSNGYDHLYANEIRLLSSVLSADENADLPRILYGLDLLSAWNFSEKDIKYINGLRTTYFTPPRSAIRTAQYNFEVKTPITGEKQNISGILPYIDADFCPTFRIVSKV